MTLIRWLPHSVFFVMCVPLALIFVGSVNPAHPKHIGSIDPTCDVVEVIKGNELRFSTHTHSRPHAPCVICFLPLICLYSFMTFWPFYYLMFESVWGAGVIPVRARAFLFFHFVFVRFVFFSLFAVTVCDTLCSASLFRCLRDLKDAVWAVLPDLSWYGDHRSQL